MHQRSIPTLFDDLFTLMVIRAHKGGVSKQSGSSIFITGKPEDTARFENEPRRRVRERTLMHGPGWTARDSREPGARLWGHWNMLSFFAIEPDTVEDDSSIGDTQCNENKKMIFVHSKSRTGARIFQTRCVFGARVCYQNCCFFLSFAGLLACAR